MIPIAFEELSGDMKRQESLASLSLLVAAQWA
jgi:hypothetical protein